jgi:hypothetical protein
MSIPDAMYQKAQRLITADAEMAYKKANPRPPRPGRLANSYSLPQRSADLVQAMNKGDAEAVASIMLYQFGRKLSEAEL